MLTTPTCSLAHCYHYVYVCVCVLAPQAVDNWKPIGQDGISPEASGWAGLKCHMSVCVCVCACACACDTGGGGIS